MSRIANTMRKIDYIPVIWPGFSVCFNQLCTLCDSQLMISSRASTYRKAVRMVGHGIKSLAEVAISYGVSSSTLGATMSAQSMGQCGTSEYYIV